MTQGAPGVFWNINLDFSGDFSSGSNQITNGIIVEKGVWDTIAQDVVWTATEITQQFDSFLSGTVTISAATAFNIGFDPSGQYGWIACLGDITGDSVYEPIFWKSVDGGNTWSTPIIANLDSLPGVFNGLNAYTYGGLSVPLSASTTFEGRLTVDYLGNPHFFTTVSNGVGYQVYADAGYKAYDITYSATPLACDSSWNGWSAVFIDSIQTLLGDYTTDNPSYTEYNRPLLSRTRDGKKIFFFWLDSDINFWGSDENDGPNLFARGFDLTHYTSTPVFNLTANDSLFGGQTSYSTAGLFAIGANFPVISPTAHQVGDSINIPLVLTQIDYLNATGGNKGSGVNPAAFWYINNVTFTPADFSNGLSAAVQVLGSNPDTLLAGNLYVDQGATFQYTDTTCHPAGFLHIVTDTSNVNTNNTGIFYVYYLAEDSNGNVYASGSREVFVVGPPVANFSYLVSGSRVLFTDLSTNNPTSWAWNFGDNGTDNNPDPTHNYAIAHNGTYTYTVCLTSSNQYGSSAQICKLITIVYTGIDQVDFSQNISLYPNPSNGLVFINMTSAINSDYTVSVYNVLGEQVLGNVEEKAGTDNVQLNLGSLSNGTYLVKLRSAEGTAVKQVVLTHSN